RRATAAWAAPPACGGLEVPVGLPVPAALASRDTRTGSAAAGGTGGNGGGGGTGGWLYGDGGAGGPAVAAAQAERLTTNTLAAMG
ncbi:hypothetical protein OSI94_16590, partial [Mycobacterium ulcerans]